MSSLGVVTDADFADTVAGGPVLVDFWATWCSPCEQQKPVLEAIAGEFGDQLTVVQMEVDANPETVAAYDVGSLPLMILFRDGKPVHRILGLTPKIIVRKEIAPHLG
jgi:thioredoxin 1